MSGMKFESNLHQSNLNQAGVSSSKNVSKYQNKNQEFLVPINNVNFDTSKRHLYLQILNGKAFIEYLTPSDSDEQELLPGYSNHATTSYFTLYVHFRGQRFKTQSFECSCEPKINEGFMLELHKDRHGSELTSSLMADTATMLSISDPIHLVLVKTDATQETHLVSSHFLEWRTVLSSVNCKQMIAIELMGTGAESKITAGLFNVCLQLVPGLEEPVREDVLGAQLGMEHSKNTERERLFLIYAKQWWKEYLEIRDDNKNRLVKIFAQVGIFNSHYSEKLKTMFHKKCQFQCSRMKMA
jgi:centrosomal protein CEP76